MQFNRVGRSGLKFSAVALGSATTFLDLRQSGVRELVRGALDAGIRTFDFSDVEGAGEAERMFGYLAADYRREDVVIVTKVGRPMSESPLDRGLSRKHILESIRHALARLQTEYLDVYLCDGYDAETPVDEIVRAMDHLMRAGQILYWGAAGWTPTQLAEAVAVAADLGCPGPVVNALPLSVVERPAATAGPAAMRELGLGCMATRVLGGGVLTGKYGDEIPAYSRAGGDEAFRAALRPGDVAAARKLGPIAAELGVTSAQLALAWALHQDGVTCAVMGATSREQVAENTRAGDIALDAATLAAIQAAAA